MMKDKENGAHESTDAHLDTYLMSSQARVEFGLNRARMTKLMASGRLPFEPDPLDKRLKWVKRRNVMEITNRSGIYQRRQLQQQPPPEQQLPNCHSAHVPVPNTATMTCKRPRRGKLYPSDKVVLDLLTRLCAATGKDYTPPIGVNTIAERCDLCPRTVQACGDRLIAANRIERVGYDVGNRDRKKRGMVYRVLGIPQNALYSSADIATVVE